MSVLAGGILFNTFRVTSCVSCNSWIVLLLPKNHPRIPRNTRITRNKTSRLSAVSIVSKAMNIIFILLLALTPAARSNQSPAQARQSRETAPISITELRKAPTRVVIDGRSLTLSAYLWRDFMPGTLSDPNGSPMMAVFKVATSDKKPFPSGVRIERAWVLFGEQVWEPGEFDPRKRDLRQSNDSRTCLDTPVCEVSARNGPKWGPNVYVDVVVRLIDKEGQDHLLQATRQYVQRTD
jgi:hypothetical protein